MVALGFPVIRLEDIHNQASGKGGEYRLAPTPGVILEAGHYEIPKPEKLKDVEPSALHVIISSEEVYRIDWNARGRIVLDAQTLTRVRGQGEFGGFVAGTQYVMGIGQERPGDHPEQIRFAVMWAGILQVA